MLKEITTVFCLAVVDWIVDERCVKLIEELENYTWKKDKKTNEYINEPVDSYNHCIDAIRYALQDRIYKTRIKLFKGGF